jgi:hypothetical protein
MQLDQTRKQQVAGEIFGMIRGTAFADFDDGAVHGRDPPGLVTRSARTTRALAKSRSRCAMGILRPPP